MGHKPEETLDDPRTELDESEEQFMERVGLSSEQMLADALHDPEHWSLRAQPTAVARCHEDGTCVPCYFHLPGSTSD